IHSCAPGTAAAPGTVAAGCTAGCPARVAAPDARAPLTPSVLSAPAAATATAARMMFLRIWKAPLPVTRNGGSGPGGGVPGLLRANARGAGDRPCGHGAHGAWVAGDLVNSQFEEVGGVLLHWTGSGWVDVKLPFQTRGLGPLSHDGHGGLWI